MNLMQDRRVLLAGGAGLALLAGVLIAGVFKVRETSAPQTAAKGSLQVELGEQGKLDPSRQLRCFVGGQFVGMATLADCAKKNGVAAQALDVGLDQSGALSASSAPKPPPPAVQTPAPPPLATAPVPAAPVGDCLRYGAEGWRATGGAVTLSACVHTLFDGRCPRPGEALYGRWSGQTLRLVPGRVETSPDNRTFQLLMEQGRDCTVPNP